jgi:hypothetical protein
MTLKHLAAGGGDTGFSAAISVVSEVSFGVAYGQD